ncbi:MAG: hypothetical protein M1816_001806 [Peltula sp. TS41687]|nr:MAG: hypothetical protein M1816_001806 [Peltula sp. TS41687]
MFACVLYKLRSRFRLYSIHLTYSSIYMSQASHLEYHRRTSPLIGPPPLKQTHQRPLSLQPRLDLHLSPRSQRSHLPLRSPTIHRAHPHRQRLRHRGFIIIQTRGNQRVPSNRPCLIGPTIDETAGTPRKQNTIRQQPLSPQIDLHLGLDEQELEQDLLALIESLDKADVHQLASVAGGVDGEGKVVLHFTDVVVQCAQAGLEVLGFGLEVVEDFVGAGLGGHFGVV